MRVTRQKNGDTSALRRMWAGAGKRREHNLGHRAQPRWEEGFKTFLWEGGRGVKTLSMEAEGGGTKDRCEEERQELSAPQMLM